VQRSTSALPFRNQCNGFSGLLTQPSKNGQKNRKYQANNNEEKDCRLRAEKAVRMQDSGFGIRGNAGLQGEKRIASSPPVLSSSGRLLFDA
jgi:hypothetical protein